MYIEEFLCDKNGKTCHLNLIIRIKTIVIISSAAVYENIKVITKVWKTSDYLLSNIYKYSNLPEKMKDTYFIMEK